jgi:hypothetical protein
MDFGDPDPTFLAGRGPPASGPISSGTRLQICTTPIAPGVFRATLPLAPDATPGASITYRIGSVTGALLPTDAPSLTGTVIAGAAGTSLRGQVHWSGQEISPRGCLRRSGLCTVLVNAIGDMPPAVTACTLKR